MKKIKLIILCLCMVTSFSILGCSSKIETSNNSGSTEENGKKEEKKEVYNNGNHFVGYGDEVYFLKPTKEAMTTPQLFGEFVDLPCGKSTLLSYNTKDNSIENLFDADMYGKIYISGEKIFVNTSETEESEKRLAIFDINTKET